MATEKENTTFIEFLPVSLFGGILGMAGLSFSWNMAAHKWGFRPWAGQSLGILTLAFFIILCAAYVIKWIRYPASVKNELDHPVSISFFTTFIVSLLLIPGILLWFHAKLAFLVWCIGVVMIIAFTWFLVRRWISHRQDPANALPPWLLPVVGLLDVPIIGNQFHYPGARELCLLCFGAGLMLGLIFMPIIMARLIFQPALPIPLQPTLLVLVLPFAIIYSDYDGFSGASGVAGSALFYAGLFMLFVSGSRILLLAKCCPFRVGWWAVSFPLSAITLAAFRYAVYKPSGIYQAAPAFLLTILTLTIAFLLLQTGKRILQKRFVLGDPISEQKMQAISP